MDKNDSNVERYREEEAREADREAMGLKIDRDGMRARGSGEGELERREIGAKGEKTRHV